MKEKKVSVVVPHYNRNELLNGLVQSVARQTYRPIELIIVDDGSDVFPGDLPMAVFGIEVQVVGIAHCGRPGLVRNAGIDAATGAYVAFLDSDDSWVPDKLERQVVILESNKDIDLVHGNAILREDGKEKLYLDCLPDSHCLKYSELLRRDFVLTSSVVVRREVLDTERFCHLGSAQDYELWLRLIKKHKFHYLSAGLYFYSQQRSDSVSRKGALRFLSLLEIFKLELEGAPLSENKRIILQRIAGYYLKLAKWSFLSGKMERCRKLILKSLRTAKTRNALITFLLFYVSPRLLGFMYTKNSDF